MQTTTEPCRYFGNLQANPDCKGCDRYAACVQASINTEDRAGPRANLPIRLAAHRKDF